MSEKQLVWSKEASSLLSTHFSDTHVHGLPHINRSESFCRKAFWAIIFLISLSFCLYLLVQNFMRYASHPVQTRIEPVPTYRLQFPGVTVCNNNAVRRSSFEYLQQQHDFPADPDANAALINATIYNTSQVHEHEDGFESWEVDWQSNGGPLQERAIFNLINTHMSMEEKIEHGHQLEDMLLSCYLSAISHRCTSKDFVRTVNALHGNCYTFNSGAHNTSILDVRRVGTPAGLTMEFYIESEEYILSENDATGMRVVVQSPSYMPFAERDGVSVAPGTSTYIGVKPVQMITAGPPYSNCIEEDDYYTESLNAWHLIYPHIGYTKIACGMSCYQWQTFRHCGCGDSWYPLVYPILDGGQVVGVGNISVCHSNEEVACMYEMWGRFSNKDLNCTVYCRPLCNNTIHNTKSSFANWPSKPKEPIVIDSLKHISPKLGERLDNMTAHERSKFLKDNTLKIVIYFSRFEHERIITEPAYSWVSLLSDQGGQVGLWVGLSIVSLFELVELLCDICRLGFRIGRQDRKPSPENNHATTIHVGDRNYSSAL